MAISSPLLETAINGAKGVIINITSSPDIGLDEIETASSMIASQAHEDANIIWGAAFDENMDDEMSVTVIATGFATSAGDEPVSKSKEKQEEGSHERAAVHDGSSIEDDDFTDIMQIFNRKS